MGALGAMRAALAATAGSAGVAIPICLIFATIAAVVTHLILGDVANVNLMDSKNILRLALGLPMGFLGVEIVLGPIFAGVAVYVGRNGTGKGAAGLYDAVNFALNRYSKMFMPHLAAQLSIQIGMLVLLPGILFFLQFAFVDAVASLEKEKWPLARSKKLTRGRRRTLFLLLLPYLVFSQAWTLVDLWALSQAPWLTVGTELVRQLYMFVLVVACYALYEDRTRPAPATEAAPNPQAEVTAPIG